MKKILLVTVIFICFFNTSLSQKKVIDILKGSEWLSLKWSKVGTFNYCTYFKNKITTRSIVSGKILETYPKYIKIINDNGKTLKYRQIINGNEITSPEYLIVIENKNKFTEYYLINGKPDGQETFERQ